MTLEFRVSDASGIVVAECSNADDALLIGKRWGPGSTVLVLRGHRYVEALGITHKRATRRDLLSSVAMIDSGARR